MKVTVIGAGSWGIALAKLLHDNGNEVAVWSALSDEIEMLNREHEHVDKLKGVKLPEDMIFTTDLKAACENAGILVMAVPSVFVRSTAKTLKEYYKNDQIIVNVAKGIEESTLDTMTDIISEEIPGCTFAVLSGPSHAEEVGRGIPTTIVVGAKKREVAEKVQEVFMSPVFRVYTSPDVLGIEIGAALKNVIALAAGMADGYGLGDNAKAALITRGIAEISRLGMAMGGKFESFAGLSGIGDLVVTCASMHSRNRRAGILIGQGKSMQEAMDEVKMVVEGVYSAKAALALARQYDVDMPIVQGVNEILFEGKSVEEGITELMIRERRIENSSLDW